MHWLGHSLSFWRFNHLILRKTTSWRNIIPDIVNWEARDYFTKISIVSRFDLHHIRLRIKSNFWKSRKVSPLNCKNINNARSKYLKSINFLITFIEAKNLIFHWCSIIMHTIDVKNKEYNHNYRLLSWKLNCLPNFMRLPRLARKVN